MDNEQIQSLISQLKAVGLEDEQIMDVFYEAFTKGKMDRKDLETLAESLGYELDDDFKAEPTPDPIEGDKPEGDAPEAEDLKEIKPGESVEEFKDKIEEAKEDGEGEVEEKEEEKEESHDDEDTDEGEEEDEEWDEANKYFKI